MLARRLRNKNTKDNTEKPVNFKLLGVVIIGILSITIVMQAMKWFSGNERKLLVQAPGLMQPDNPQELLNAIQEPTQVFDAELYSSGLYSQTNDHIEKGTITLIYTKDDWRFIQIDYLPNIQTQEYLALWSSLPQEEITLSQNQPAWILTVDNRPRCIDYEDSVPNRCEISQQLILQVDERMVAISVDGNHATNGQLIEIANSIIKTD
jgi:hypothetical protein